MGTNFRQSAIAPDAVACSRFKIAAEMLAANDEVSVPLCRTFDEYVRLVLFGQNRDDLVEQLRADRTIVDPDLETWGQRPRAWLTAAVSWAVEKGFASSRSSERSIAWISRCSV